MTYIIYIICRVRQTTFYFWKCFKKTTEYFLFHLKVQSFWLIIENNVIEMAASAGYAVAYTIGTTFKYIIDRVQMYFNNGFPNNVL